MYDYKVEYVYTREMNKKWYQSTSPLDAWSLAKELEALLLQYKEDGYEVLNISPIQNSEVISGSFAVTKTDGLLVTFKKKDAGI